MSGVTGRLQAEEVLRTNLDTKTVFAYCARPVQMRFGDLGAVHHLLERETTRGEPGTTRSFGLGPWCHFKDSDFLGAEGGGKGTGRVKRAIVSWCQMTNVTHNRMTRQLGVSDSQFNFALFFVTVFGKHSHPLCLHLSP